MPCQRKHVTGIFSVKYKVLSDAFLTALWSGGTKFLLLHVCIYYSSMSNEIFSNCQLQLCHAQAEHLSS